MNKKRDSMMKDDDTGSELFETSSLSVPARPRNTPLIVGGVLFVLVVVIALVFGMLSNGLRRRDVDVASTIEGRVSSLATATLLATPTPLATVPSQIPTDGATPPPSLSPSLVLTVTVTPTATSHLSTLSPDTVLTLTRLADLQGTLAGVQAIQTQESSQSMTSVATVTNGIYTAVAMTQTAQPTATPPILSYGKMLSGDGFNLRDAYINGAVVGRVCFGDVFPIYEVYREGQRNWYRITEGSFPPRWVADRDSTTGQYESISILSDADITLGNLDPVSSQQIIDGWGSNRC